MIDSTTDWLLEGPPWVAYRTRRDLLGLPETGAGVRAARQEMLAHPRIQALVAELLEWPGPLLKSHKDAKHPLHKLTFLADLGLRIGDPGVGELVDRIMENPAPEGPFQVLVNIHPRYGGSGIDQWGWMLCDAPLVLYALLKFGMDGDPRVYRAVEHLTGLVRENGWPCAVSPALGSFRGPGRKTDPCPYANLAVLKLLSQVPEWRDDEVARVGAETLLGLWEQRKTRRPYLFAMGSDFAKLKAPLIWYDLLHVLDVLTKFPWLQDDPCLREMGITLAQKTDELGRFTPESVWLAWKDWDFGQKKTPSTWLTLIARRALNRLVL